MAMRARLGTGADPVALPQSKPRVRCIHIVVLSVRCLKVGQPEPPSVRQCENSLQPVYLGDSFLSVHGVSDAY